MYCGNCGTKSDDGAVFCPNCGTKLVSFSSPVPQTSVEQPTPVATAPEVNAAPVVEPAPAEEPTPAVEAASAVEPAPAVEPVPVVEPTSTVEPAPAVEPVPAAEQPTPEPEPETAPQGEPAMSSPFINNLKLKTNRGLLKFVLLSVITLLTYPLWVILTLVEDLNITAGPRDGKKTMSPVFVLCLDIVTLFVYHFIYWSKLSGRVSEELKARNISYKFGKSTFWLWNVLGLLILVGPFIYHYKLFKSMNMIAENYNTLGR